MMRLAEQTGVDTHTAPQHTQINSDTRPARASRRTRVQDRQLVTVQVPAPGEDPGWGVGDGGGVDEAGVGRDRTEQERMGSGDGMENDGGRGGGRATTA